MIGVFDSGVGGLSVLKQLRANMPHADFVYFGDTEHAPYGPRSAHDIAELIAMALRRLAHEGAFDIVSACNSASVSVHTVPIDLLRINQFNVVEMVGPTVAALAPGGKKITLLGTVATIRSQIYQDAFESEGVTIDAVAVPALAGLIENGAPESEIYPVVQEAVSESLQNGAEILSLSCTHYPFVKELFEKALREHGSAAEIFDPAHAVAREVMARFPHEGNGTLRFLISQESQVFRDYVARLCGGVPYSVELAPPLIHALVETRHLG